MINVFDSLQYLEPKCPHCDSKIEYGETTRYDDETRTHVCIKCNHPLD
ncbi:hypothetical protein K9M79_06000 [Candidatus Woesearchaeota archaeon]|nr:hypothetical protein [Candidatus Woesearchaeota archaeon]